MNTSHVILWSAIALVFILCVVRFVKQAEVDDRVKIPVHVPLNIADQFTAQEVFDWVVYVTKVDGLTYASQMAWDPFCKHDVLLHDLSRVAYMRNETEREQWFTSVAQVHSLDAEMVTSPH